MFFFCDPARDVKVVSIPTAFSYNSLIPVLDFFSLFQTNSSLFDEQPLGRVEWVGSTIVAYDVLYRRRHAVYSERPPDVVID